MRTTLPAMGRTVKISELKAHCLRLVEEVARKRRDILITKRGKPIARVVPLDTRTDDDALARLPGRLDQSTAVPGLEVLPLTIPVVVTAARLTELHDPADQLIVATAQHHGARLVTSDARIAATRAVSIVG